MFFRRKIKSPVFIHIPKTGGTYVCQGETDGDTVIKPIQIVGHTYFVCSDKDLNPLYEGYDPKNAAANTIDKRDFANQVKFSVVRNIFEWLVSYAGHAGCWNNQYVNEDHYDFENATRGFDYLLKTIANRTDIWPNRKFLFCQNFASDGELMPHWVMDTGRLDDELRSFARDNGLTYSKKQKQRVGAKKDFRECFSDELVELTMSTWSRELQIYGYKFGASSENAILAGKISANVKKKLRYSYSTDELQFGDLNISTGNLDLLLPSCA